jgi:hypothetical protein
LTPGVFRTRAFNARVYERLREQKDEDEDEKDKDWRDEPAVVREPDED